MAEIGETPVPAEAVPQPETPVVEEVEAQNGTAEVASEPVEPKAAEA
jgi:hypothetical protein